MLLLLQLVGAAGRTGGKAGRDLSQAESGEQMKAGSGGSGSPAGRLIRSSQKQKRYVLYAGEREQNSRKWIRNQSELEKTLPSC